MTKKRRDWLQKNNEKNLMLTVSYSYKSIFPKESIYICRLSDNFCGRLSFYEFPPLKRGVRLTPRFSGGNFPQKLSEYLFVLLKKAKYIKN